MGGGRGSGRRWGVGGGGGGWMMVGSGRKWEQGRELKDLSFCC